MLSGLSWHQSGLSVEYCLWVDILLISIIKLGTGYQEYEPVMLSCMMGQYLPSLQHESHWVAVPAHYHSLSLSPI